MAAGGPKEPRRYDGVETRVQLFALGVAIALGLLAFQFWRLQVVQLAEFAALADNNRVWQERLKSDRGIIYARNGEVLADNRASVDVVFVPGDCSDCSAGEDDCTPCDEEQLWQICSRLATLLSIDGEALFEKVRDTKGAPFTQLTVKRDVSQVDKIRIEEQAAALPGVFIVVHPQRRYHFGETAGQILGFLGEINKDELATRRELGYTQGDLIGKGGVERQYEELMHGQDGYMLVTKYASGRPQMRTDRKGMPYVAPRDSQGHVLEEVENARKAPQSGQSLRLNLDIGLQEKCEALLHGEVGSIVVLDADSGEVLALASVPTYDPSVFVDRGRSEERLELLQAKDPSPMFSIAYRENFPPGSVYKVMLATAALEEGIITRDSTYYCPGFFRINGQGRPWRCWRHSGHGTVNVVGALAFSCDVFFYNVGLELGIDRIVEWSHAMGLGVTTGIDLPGETKGLIPSPEWLAEYTKNRPAWEQKWRAGDTVNTSIGQGSVNTTPLQNAVMMACVMNGGRRVRPYLNAELGPQSSDKFISDETISIVQEGMLMCVEKKTAPSGTGKLAKIEGYTIIGKTGTAQVASLEHHKKYASEEEIPYEIRDHAWFVAGVLDRTPRIAMCILVEHGLHGSSTAAPLAKEVIQYFYERPQDQAPLTIAQGAP